MDNLFKHTCEFDNRTYHKIKTSELDNIDCLSKYKKDIRGFGLASNLKNKIASKNIDNFAVDDEELKAVKEELADKKEMLDADFNAIEEEVRNQMTQAGIVDSGEVVDIEEFRKKRKKWVPKIVK